MTREMNKPDWHYEYIIHHTTVAGTIFERIKVERERKLDDWIKPYIDSLNERLSQCGKQ